MSSLIVRAGRDKIVKIMSSILITVFFGIPSVSSARSGCCSHHGGVCGCGCCDGTPLSSTCAPYYPECNSQPKTIMPKTTTPKIIAPTISYSYPEEIKSIPFEKRTQNSTDMFIGETKISQAGVAGEKTFSYKITHSDGKETNRITTGEKVTKVPIDEITLIGTKEKSVVVDQVVSQPIQNKTSFWSSIVNWLKGLFK